MGEAFMPGAGGKVQKISVTGTGSNTLTFTGITGTPSRFYIFAAPSGSRSFNYQTLACCFLEASPSASGACYAISLNPSSNPCTGSYTFANGTLTVTITTANADLTYTGVFITL